MKKIIYNLAILATVGGSVLTSCSRDFTETKFYQTELATDISTVEQMRSFVNGIYLKMRSTNYLGNKYKAIAQVHTDETFCTQASGRNVPFSTYSMTSQNGDAYAVWYSIYQVVGNANIVINTPDNLTIGGATLGASGKKEVKYLKGQAYAARALAFFDLLKLYGQKYTSGDLGIVLPLKYDPNAKMGRATVAETEKQIESDFQMALDYMKDSGDVSDKTHLNEWSVKALLSRYYLYKKDYQKAREYANEVINSGAYTVAKSGDLELSFSKENAENSVFELATGLNGALGTASYDYIMNVDGYGNIAVLPDVVKFYDSNDVRAKLLVSDGFDYLNKKFPSLTGANNIKVIRFEEVLLNAAEAELNGGTAANALKYYNMIVENRGLAAATSVTLSDIKKERSKELLGEGLRYWDLLRWGDVIPYFTEEGKYDAQKDKTVGDNLLAFPIPRKETDIPGSLVKSNPGYDN